MDVSYIYFDELELNNGNNIDLNFSSNKSGNKHDFIFTRERLFDNKYVFSPQH